MSKKRKKKQEPIATEKKPTRATNLKVITRIECLRDNSVLTQQTCQACEFHDNRYCTYNKPKKLIKTLGIGSPMRFNRNFFQMSSDNLREASLNYYIATDIMNDVRSIEGYPNYRKLKTSLLSGEFKQDDKEPKPTPSIKGKDIKCLYYLKRATGMPSQLLESCVDPSRDRKAFNPEDFEYDLLVNGHVFFIQETTPVIDGEWEVLYYLYRVYELDGFGDLELDGQPYRVIFNEVKNRKADFFVAQQEDAIVIGKVVKKDEK